MSASGEVKCPDCGTPNGVWYADYFRVFYQCGCGTVYYKIVGTIVVFKIKDKEEV